MFCLKQKESNNMAIHFIFLILYVQIRLDVHGSVHGSVISQKFTRYKTSRNLGEVGYTFQAGSHFECCAACVQNEIFTCEVVNFVEGNGTCQLLKYPTTFLSTVPGWNMYILMAPTTTTSSISSTRTTSAVPTTTSRECVDDWCTYGNKCYKIITAGGRTWDDALTACNNYGGTLASLQTKAKFDFIVSQLDYVEYSRLWIGLRDNQGMNTEYLWMDGTVLVYDVWHSGEPSSQNDPCVQLMFTDGKYGFSDRACRQAIYQLCEKNLE